MKVNLLLFVILFYLSSCTQKKVDTPKIDAAAEIEIAKGLVQGSFDAIWSGLDTSALSTFHTSDFILLEHGMVWNNDTIRNYLLRETPNKLSKGYERLNRFDYIAAKHRGESIWLAYHNYGTWVLGEDTLRNAEWLESIVAVKEKGTWKLEQMHSTRVKRN